MQTANLSVFANTSSSPTTPGIVPIAGPIHGGMLR
jgi:hypothetical protein